LANKVTPQETRLGITYLWTYNLSPQYLSFYNFFYQIFYEIYQILLYQFKFLLLFYHIIFSIKGNINIFFFYFFKINKKIRKLKMKIKKKKNKIRLKLIRIMKYYAPIEIEFNIKKKKKLKNKFKFFNYFILITNIFKYKIKSNINFILFNKFIPLFFNLLNKFNTYSFYFNFIFKNILMSSQINYFMEILMKKYNIYFSSKKNRKYFFLNKISYKKYMVQLLKKLSFKQILQFKYWFYLKIFNFILKYNLLYFFDKFFFKFFFLLIFFSFKHLQFFNNIFVVKKNILLTSFKKLKFRFFKRNIFYFNLIINFCVIHHHLYLILFYLELFLHKIFARRKFVRKFCNIFNYFYLKKIITAWSFLLRGTIEKHGRTISFLIIKGKLSLQTFNNLIFYDYIQCYQKHGVFGLHFWLRYRNLLN
jgi:hypothetical protein